MSELIAGTIPTRHHKVEFEGEATQTQQWSVTATETYEYQPMSRWNEEAHEYELIPENERVWKAGEPYSYRVTAVLVAPGTVQVDQSTLTIYDEAQLEAYMVLLKQIKDSGVLHDDNAL